MLIISALKQLFGGKKPAADAPVLQLAPKPIIEPIRHIPVCVYASKKEGGFGVMVCTHCGVDKGQPCQRNKGDQALMTAYKLGAPMDHERMLEAVRLIELHEGKWPPARRHNEEAGPPRCH